MTLCLLSHQESYRETDLKFVEHDNNIKKKYLTVIAIFLSEVFIRRPVHRTYSLRNSVSCFYRERESFWLGSRTEGKSFHIN